MIKDDTNSFHVVDEGFGMKEAILEFEPRINVTDIQVTGYVDQNVVMITITYYVIRSGAKGVYSKTFEV
jgi:phage baseplate assembly protein W